MLLHREIVQPDTESGFRFLVRRQRSFPFCWHHHPECELTWIARGSGTRFVGDDLRAFDSGDLVLLGPDLPHSWWSSEPTDTQQEAFCVQFGIETVTELVGGRPDESSLRGLLEESRFGLEFAPEVAAGVGASLRRMEDAGGLGRFGLLLECLDLLARSTRRTRLCSEPRTGAVETSARIDAACQYVVEHLDEPIRQPDVAAVVGMSPVPFARFFRKHSGQTLTSYIQHSRIGRACALLRDTHDSVLAIAYASGFQNLSNFNRTFKRLRGITPREYRARIDAGRRSARPPTRPDA
jgi:AraC-like DNA-binding protein